MVRKAKVEDYEAIMALRERYMLNREELLNPDNLANIQKEGFLIFGYKKTDFLNDINSFFFVYEEEGKVIGYIRINNHTETGFHYDRLNVWINNDYKDIYFNEEKHAEIGAFVVLKEYRDTKVGKELLHKAISTLRERGYKYLFANVVYAPIINKPGMFFYEENGFEKICLTTPANMNDLENFQGLLYVKNL